MNTIDAIGVGIDTVQCDEPERLHEQAGTAIAVEIAGAVERIERYALRSGCIGIVGERCARAGNVVIGVHRVGCDRTVAINVQAAGVVVVVIVVAVQGDGLGCRDDCADGAVVSTVIYIDAVTV